VTNGRFKGGYTTRHYGRPHEGFTAPMRAVLERILTACIGLALEVQA
jgi:N-formylglutamate amidohydrolase